MKLIHKTYDDFEIESNNRLMFTLIDGHAVWIECNTLFVESDLIDAGNPVFDVIVGGYPELTNLNYFEVLQYIEENKNELAKGGNPNE